MGSSVYEDLPSDHKGQDQQQEHSDVRGLMMEEVL